MKRLISLLLVLAAVLSLAGCGGGRPLSSKAVATVTNGNKTVSVNDLEGILAAVDASGNTTVKLWKDITTDAPIRLPYSCTLDLNGYSITTNPKHGNAMMVMCAGSENAVTTVKNGTIFHYGTGVEVQAGGIVVDGVTFYSASGAPVSLLDPDPAYRQLNRITNSKLYAGTAAAVIFGSSGADYMGAGIAIDNSVLVCPNQAGTDVFLTRGTGGTVELGENVDIYSYGETLAQVGFYYAGLVAPRSEQPQSVTVGDTAYENMNHWSTANDSDALNLLMIANSFCYYYVEELYGISQAAGVNMNVTNLYEAGCRIDEHWAWLSSKESGKDKYEFWLTNSMGRYRHGDIRTSYEALEYLDWDMISTQQHFTTGKAKTYEVAMECAPFAKNVYDYLKKSNPEAQLYWQAHWAFQVGHDIVPDVQTQTLQYTNSRAASVTICEQNGVSMVPTGDAWQLARANPLFGDTLCKSDNIHDGTTGGGQYLNACVWFEVLTGKSCLGNTWRPDYLLPEEKIVTLQQLAHQAVAEVYGADYAK